MVWRRWSTHWCTAWLSILVPSGYHSLSLTLAVSHSSLLGSHRRRPSQLPSSPGVEGWKSCRKNLPGNWKGRD